MSLRAVMHWRYGTPDVLAVEEIALPVPGDGGRPGPGSRGGSEHRRFAVGNVLFGNFEEGTPKWRRLLKLALVMALGVSIPAA